MRVGFFGTPGIASYALEQLCNRFHIVFAVTAPDKPRGRNRKIRICETKDTAQCHEIPCLHPDSLTDPEFLTALEGYRADIFVVVAYGRIIPREVFDMPPLKTINLHPSLLPKYRGAAPIPWALIDGETETGVTIQRINEELDAGDILLQESFSIGENMTSGEVYDLVQPLGARLLADTITGLSEGIVTPREQDHEEATWCGKITRETARINWNKSALEIHNLVRGMNPKPAAWTTFREKIIKIWRTAIPELKINLKPCELHVFEKHRLLAGTGSGCIEILSIQPENKKAIDGQSFINGYRLERTESFS